MYNSIDSARIINLKVVSKLKRGEKLNTRYYRFTIESIAMFSPQFFFRWVNGESRDQTIDALDSLISSCVMQSGSLEKPELDELISQLMLASQGIQNLAQTYKDDPTTCAGIEMILEKISFFVNKHGLNVNLQIVNSNQGL